MGSAPWASHVAADGTRAGREHRTGPRRGTYDRCPGHPGRRILRKRDGKEMLMKFMLTFTLKPETKGRDEAIARFKKTGGQPPKGVKLLGRWTAADFSGGFDLLERAAAAPPPELPPPCRHPLGLTSLPVPEA